MNNRLLYQYRIYCPNISFIFIKIRICNRKLCIHISLPFFNPSVLSGPKEPLSLDKHWIHLFRVLIFVYAEFTRLTIWHATTPAVSVLNREGPRDTLLKPFLSASCISCGLKSPSGPISTILSEFSSIISFR